MATNIGTSKQLFLDDLLIENTYKIGRVIHQPKKDSRNPLMKKEGKESPHPHFFGTVLFDNGRFRMWYSPFWGNEDFGGIAYAESNDGISWEKPSLGLVKIQGNRSNNLIFFEKTPQAVFQPNVIKLSDGNKETGQYKMLYWDRPSLDKRTHGVSVAFSNDGIHWQKYEKNPVWSTPLDRSMHRGGADDVICASYDKLTKKYRAFRRVLPNESPVYRGPEDDYFKAGDYLRVIAAAESEDLIKWENFKVILKPDQQDRADTQFYGMGGFNYFGTYIGMLWIYHTDSEEETIDVQLATSRDGINWERVGNREVFLPLGQIGAFDEKMIFTGNEPLIVGDEIWMYYSGHNNKHQEPKREQTLEGIGLAKLRLDGFVSLQGKECIGNLMTKVLRFKGCKLIINAKTEPDGFIGVEILDENGNPIRGKTLEDCDKFTGDSVRKTVSWREKERLDNLQVEPIKLRFHIKRGEIYSFQFADQL